MSRAFRKVYSFPLLLGVSLFIVWHTSKASVSPRQPVLSTRESLEPGRGFTGNPDAYGLGIRLGYYTQALSVWLANFFAPEEAHALHRVNILFVYAMIVGLAFLSRAPADLFAVEPFILIQITMGIAFVGTETVRTGALPWQNMYSTSTVLKDLALVGMAVYNVWFWWEGLPLMKHTPGLESTVFFFSRVNLYGWVSTFYQVLSIFYVISRCFFLVWTVINKLQDLLFRRGRFISLEAELHSQLSQELDEALRSRHHGMASGKLQEQHPEIDHHPISTRNLNERNFERSVSAPPTVMTFPHHLTDSDTAKTSTTGGEEAAIAPTKPPIPNAATITFADLQTADAYLQSLLDSTPNDTPSQSAWSVTIIPNFLRIYWPARRKREPLPWPSLGELSHSLPAALPLIPLMLTYVHRKQNIPQFRIPWYRYPELVHRILSPAPHALPTWRHMAALTRIHLHAAPPRNTISRVYSALLTLAIALLLVASAELPLVWNHVTGVNTLASVGQLVPCVLGIGGLANVVWGVCKRAYGWNRKRGGWGTVEGGNEWERCAVLYERLVDLSRAEKGGRQV